MKLKCANSRAIFDTTTKTNLAIIEKKQITVRANRKVGKVGEVNRIDRQLLRNLIHPAHLPRLLTGTNFCPPPLFILNLQVTSGRRQGYSSNLTIFHQVQSPNL